MPNIPYLPSLLVTVFSLLHKRRQIIFNHNILIKIMLRPDPTFRFLVFAQLLFTLDYKNELDCQLAAWQLIWWQMNDISLIQITEGDNRFTIVTHRVNGPRGRGGININITTHSFINQYIFLHLKNCTVTSYHSLASDHNHTSYSWMQTSCSASSWQLKQSQPAARDQNQCPVRGHSAPRYTTWPLLSHTAASPPWAHTVRCFSTHGQFSQSQRRSLLGPSPG